MDIKSTMQKYIDPYAQQVQKKGKTEIEGKAKGTEQPSPEGDTVRVSSEAKLFTVAHSSVNSAPEIRQEKVDAIKKQIADGTYEIDAKSIAEKILRSDIELGKSLGS